LNRPTSENTVPPTKIEEWAIDPLAEPAAPSGVSGKQEEGFYSASKLEYDLRHHQQGLGWLGKVFGNSASAHTNIAGLVIVVSFIGYFASFFASHADLPEARKWLGTTVISALSFIFGAATRK
jgi:hypothetical protein